MPIYALNDSSALTQHLKHHVRTGTSTFAGETSKAITFDPIFDNDNVYITLIPNDNIKVNTQSITKTGFTIIPSVSFTGTVYWTAWA